MASLFPQLTTLSWAPGTTTVAIHQDGDTRHQGTKHTLRQYFGPQAKGVLTELRRQLARQPQAHLESLVDDRQLWLSAERQGKAVQLQLLSAAPARDGELMQMAEGLCGVGYWHWHLASDQFSWSPQVYRIFGLPLDHPTSLADTLSRYHQDDQQVLKALIAKASLEPIRRQFQAQILRADGEWRQVGVQGVSTAGKDGQITDIYGVIRDVTAEQQSRAQISRLALVAAQTRTSAFLCDTEGRVEWINPASEALYGYNLAELKGRRPASLLVGSQTDQDTSRRINEAMARRQHFEGDILNYRRDGKPVWVHLSITPLFHRLRHDGFIAIVSDISDRKASEERLKLYEAAFDQAEVGMLFLRPAEQGMVVEESNQAAQQLLGCTEQALLGQPFPGHFFHQALQGPLAGGDNDGQELSLAAAPERSLYVLHSPLFGPDRTPYRLVMLRETTERRRAERLEQRNQKMETLGQLVSGIAHDFNNIIGIIQGNLELLDAKLEAEHSGHKAIANALKAANRASTLTRRLSQFSRQEPVSNEEADAHQLLLDAEEMLSASLGSQIALDVELDTHSGTVRVDRGDFVDAILNLAFNARDALGEGGRIRLSCLPVLLGSQIPGLEADVRPGPYIEFVVADNGSGIAPEFKDKVLEPFFTTKPKGKGTGLGLSMVYGFAKRSKGYLSLDSAPGRGTRVHLWLPQASPLNREVLAAPQDQALLAGKRLLLVDDEADLLAVVDGLLRSFAVLVTSFADPVEARLSFGHQDYDLLLCDVEMPGINGFELAEAFGAHYPGRPVALMSGYMSQVPAHLEQLPRLAKPVSRTALLQCLISLLNRKP